MSARCRAGALAAAVHRGAPRRPRRRAGLRRGVPIGAWTNFANHGTVVHREFEACHGDHHGAVWRLLADRVRAAGRVPHRQAVVTVDPKSNEGDQTSGIVNVGPAAAMAVGAREAGAMFRAWRRAGGALRRPARRHDSGRRRARDRSGNRTGAGFQVP